jgi:hypothetical protein
MSIPAGNGATGAPGTGPALGYLLNLLWFNSWFMLISKNNMNTCIYLIHTLSLIYIMKLLVIFGIKINRKLPSCLTIQKPDIVNRLSVSSFAASIKPPPFDGSNYKRLIGFRYLALLHQSNHHLLMVQITNVGKSGLYYG